MYYIAVNTLKRKLFAKLPIYGHKHKFIHTGDAFDVHAIVRLCLGP